MNRPLALIIDDEPDIRELLEITLGRMKIDTLAVPDLTSARQQLQASTKFNLCFTDLRLPDGNGLELVEEICRDIPNLPVAVITAYGSMEVAIQALKTGAFDFITKPINLETLRQLTKTALKLSGMSQNANATNVQIPANNQLLGVSPAIQSIKNLVQKLARNQAPVHITGESGTGKELVARLIHLQGPRCDYPFIAINCGAIPSELVESEFFGHKKGSFTGAVADKHGLFQAAEGGTLFLDEVADLPLQMQVKLLRAIQEKSVRPVGSQQEVPVNVRIISATHKNLLQLVEDGKFRQDLYYRIHVIGLEIPPLRQRAEDIPLLAEYLLDKFAQQNKVSTPMLANEAYAALCGYAFPGNVRELANILERAIALSEAGIIHAIDLKLPCFEDKDNMLEIQQISIPAIEQTLSLDASLEQVEKQLITQALKTTRWNRTAAAKLLGISFRALRYRLQKHGLDTE
jgi:two-component system response regulator PilR (NtrC family)